MNLIFLFEKKWNSIYHDTEFENKDHARETLNEDCFIPSHSYKTKDGHQVKIYFKNIDEYVMVNFVTKEEILQKAEDIKEIYDSIIERDKELEESRNAKKNKK